MYNGWTNFQTWNVSAHINNNEPLYNEVNAALDSYKRDIEKGDLGKNSIIRGVATVLQKLITSKNPLTPKHGMFADILSAGLDQVNWQEIAEAKLDAI